VKLDTTENIALMSRAIELAASSVKAGNHPFGAILVIDGHIVLEAENSVLTEKDPTRHAEMNLVSAACRTMSAEEIAKSVLFTSTEPCAMCLGAVYWSGIKSVVFACPVSALEEIAGESLHCHTEQVYQNSINPPQVHGPLLKAQAVEQHRRYWKRRS
jgi:tRNA(Arg) A34 adenosine deaminase TadA